MRLLASFWSFFTDNKDPLTFGLAVVGVSLGILNLCRDILKTRRQERTLLKVIPKLGRLTGRTLISNADDIPDATAILVVEVVNHSHFPVYLDALLLLTDSCRGDLECFVHAPPTTSQKAWPIRLERHESVTIYTPKQNVRELVTIGAKGVCVRTATNQRFEGRSLALDQVYAEYCRLPHTEQGTVDWSSVDAERQGAL